MEELAESESFFYVFFENISSEDFAYNIRPPTGWEFMKENKKFKKNTLSTKKATKQKRKNDNGQEKKKENTLSTKKASKKKRKTFFLFYYFLVFLKLLTSVLSSAACRS